MNMGSGKGAAAMNGRGDGRFASTALTPQEFARIAGLAQRHLGIRLGEEKRALVQSRLGPVLGRRGLESFTSYCEALERDVSGEALRELASRLTTNHTYFFREAAHFHFLREKALPELEARVTSRDLRIWSAGCSYGQEAYCLAMLLADYFGPGKRGWDTKVLATDISPEALETAKRGVYKPEDAAQLPARWRSAYLEPVKELEAYRIRDAVKEEVLFRRLNLIHPFPFRKPFHVIFCRNVMIYFDEKLRFELVSRFYDALAPGGYLFVGHSESVPREAAPFHYVLPSVYRK